jgi:hypothetical protein
MEIMKDQSSRALIQSKKDVQSIHHIICEYVEEEKIKLFYISGKKNPADIFTKNLD